MCLVDLLDIHFICKACMTPVSNGSSAIRHFKHSDGIEIRYGITFSFYTGLPHMLTSIVCKLSHMKFHLDTTISPPDS